MLGLVYAAVITSLAGQHVRKDRVNIFCSPNMFDIHSIWDLTW